MARLWSRELSTLCSKVRTSRLHISKNPARAKDQHPVATVSVTLIRKVTRSFRTFCWPGSVVHSASTACAPACQALGHPQRGRQYTIWPGSPLHGATFQVVLSLKVSSTLVERELGALDSKQSSVIQHLGLLGQVIPDPDISFIKQDNNLYPAYTT